MCQHVGIPASPVRHVMASIQHVDAHQPYARLTPQYDKRPVLSRSVTRN